MASLVLSAVFLAYLYIHSSNAERYYVRTYGHLRRVPDDIPYDVTHVDLKYNNISKITKKFHHLNQCVSLHLGHNSISSIEPGAFVGLSNLRILNLEHNLLTHLMIGIFTGLNSLESLILSGNKIRTIRKQVLEDLPRPLTLELTHNPLQCDTSFCWLRKEYRKASIDWNLGAHPNCEGTKFDITDKWDYWNCNEGGT